MSDTVWTDRLLHGPWIPRRYGKGPYFWLLSLIMFGWKYLYVAPTTSELLLLALTFIVFIPLYFIHFWVSAWRQLAIIALTCVIGLLWGGDNYGSSGLCIFAATMCARIHSPKSAYLMLATVFCTVASISYWRHYETVFWIPALLFGLCAGISSIIAEQLMNNKEQLLRKQEEVEHLATLAERERIARDMHDLLGHRLSVITLKAELARKLLERDAEACRKEIHDVELTAREALAEVRAAISGYRANGFTHELESARHALLAAGVELAAEIDTLDLPAHTENVLALTLREAVTNIIRHAHASRCEIRLFMQAASAVLSIRDNGAPGKHAIQEGNGLKGMKERAMMLGGEIQINTSQGMHLLLSLPTGARV